MLNNLAIKFLNGLPIINFNLPKAFCDGTETLSYSYRLNTGYAPRNYKKAFSLIKKKVLVVVGTSDESFIANAFKPEINKYNSSVEIKLLENVTHMGIVVGTEIQNIIHHWL
jgi:hypothetical protein